MAYTYVKQEEVDEFEKIFDNQKITRLEDIEPCMEFAGKIKRSYKFKEKAIPYLDRCLEFINNQDLSSEQIRDIKFSVLKTRAKIAHDTYHVHKDNFGMDLLRFLRDEQYNEQNSPERIQTILRESVECRKFVSSDNQQLFERESKDIAILKQQVKKGTVSPDRSVEELQAEAESVRKMFAEYEHTKMDVQPGSEWYIMSVEWLTKWKAYVGFDGSPGGEFPGPCSNEDIIDKDEEH